MAFRVWAAEIAGGDGNLHAFFTQKASLPPSFLFFPATRGVPLSSDRAPARLGDACMKHVPFFFQMKRSPRWLSSALLFFRKCNVTPDVRLNYRTMCREYVRLRCCSMWRFRAFVKVEKATANCKHEMGVLLLKAHFVA